MSEAPRRFRRWGLIIPFALLALVAAGWTVYWFALKAEATRRIESTLAAERDAGAEAQATIARAWGFPRELAFDLTNVSYAPPDGAWRASTPRLRVNVNPINPQHIITEIQAPIAIRYRGGRTATLSSPDLRVSVRMNGRALALAGFEGTDIAYGDPDPNGRSFTAGRAVANVRPDPRTPRAYQLSLDLERFGLARPVRAFETFGQSLARVSARVVLDEGAALLNATRRDPFAPWARAGGAARIESARIEWGPATITGQGRIGVDAARRLEGRIDIAFENPAEAIRALSRSPSLPRDAARALELFAIGAALSGDDLDTNVQAREGWLSLGGARVREVAPLY